MDVGGDLGCQRRTATIRCLSSVGSEWFAPMAAPGRPLRVVPGQLSRFVRPSVRVSSRLGRSSGARLPRLRRPRPGVCPRSVHGPGCRHEMLLAFSCKGRWFCPSCHQKKALLFAEQVVNWEGAGRQECVRVPPPRSSYAPEVRRSCEGNRSRRGDLPGPGMGTWAYLDDSHPFPIPRSR